MAVDPEVAAVRQVDIRLERDEFTRSMIRELAGTLQEVVGLDEAEGFIAVVGQRVGEDINARYQAALGKSRFSAPVVAEILVDLKRRIQGGFSIVEHTDEHIVLANTACPFAEKVDGRPALCMMTSNVFGTIVSDHLGWAKVELQETIANGASGCAVVVHLKPTAAANAAPGREYIRS